MYIYIYIYIYIIYIYIEYKDETVTSIIHAGSYVLFHLEKSHLTP